MEPMYYTHKHSWDASTIELQDVLIEILKIHVMKFLPSLRTLFFFLTCSLHANKLLVKIAVPVFQAMSWIRITVFVRLDLLPFIVNVKVGIDSS